MTPHELPIPGPAADFAAHLSAPLPVLESARIRLRAPVLTDFDAWAEVLCGPNTKDLGGPFTRDEAFAEFCISVSMWLLRGHGLWTVEDRASHEILGFVLLGFEPGDREPELGYLFRPMAQGLGLATEAALVVRDHALNRLQLPGLVSFIAPGNARSAALARRLGAYPDGEVEGSQVWRHAPKETLS